jgi:hypothetical protein
MGWTRGTAARDTDGQKVRSTSPQATAWFVVGAVDRALYELLNLDVQPLRAPVIDPQCRVAPFFASIRFGRRCNGSYQCRRD